MRSSLQSQRCSAPAPRVAPSSAWRSAPRAARFTPQAGLLDFLQLPGSKAASDSPKAAVLVEELIGLTSSTAAGTKASQERRQQISELVQELKQYSVKNAARNKLLFGKFELLFASAPAAAGSPLAGPSGLIPLGSKLPVEELEQDGSYSSSVEFKQLGFLEGSFKRSGSIRAVGSDSYQLELSETRYQAPLAGPKTSTAGGSYAVKLLYLGEALRVVEVTDQDSEDGVLLVLKRVEEEEEVEEQQQVVQAKGFGLFQQNQGPSIATISERQVRRQMAMEEAQRSSGSMKTGGPGSMKTAGPGSMKTGGPGSAKVGPGSAKVGPGSTKVVSAPAAARALQLPASDVKEARDRAAAQKKAEAEKKAEADKRAVAEKKAESERRASAEKKAEGEKRAAAEKKAEAERQVAIRELLSSLSDAVKGRQAESKKAVSELKDAERSGAAAMKKAAAARAVVQEAEEESAEVEEALAAAGAARKAAEAKLKESQSVVAVARTKLQALMKGAKP